MCFITGQQSHQVSAGLDWGGGAVTGWVTVIHHVSHYRTIVTSGLSRIGLRRRGSYKLSYSITMYLITGQQSHQVSAGLDWGGGVVTSWVTVSGARTRNLPTQSLNCNARERDPHHNTERKRERGGKIARACQVGDWTFSLCTWGSTRGVGILAYSEKAWTGTETGQIGLHDMMWKFSHCNLNCICTFALDRPQSRSSSLSQSVSPVVLSVKGHILRLRKAFSVYHSPTSLVSINLCWKEAKCWRVCFCFVCKFFLNSFSCLTWRVTWKIILWPMRKS